MAVTGERLRVRGGAAGVTARLEDLDRAGAALGWLAAQLGERAARLAALGTGPALLRTAGVSLRTWSAAEHALATAGAGLLGSAGHAGMLGLRLSVLAAAHRRADAAAAAVLRQAGTGAGYLAGATLAAAGRPGHVQLRPLPLADHRAPDPGHPGDVAVGILAGMLAGLLPGAHPPPISMRAAAARSDAVGRWTPWLDEPVGVRVVPGVPRAARPPAGLADLLDGIPSSAGPTIRIQSVERPGTRAWIVSVPGTARWSPRAAGDPFDLTGDVRLLAGRSTSVTAGVVQAMSVAGVRPGEPVLVTGYSQGGLVAARLAADPALRRRFTITHVITAGSPIAWSGVPDRVHVLALEHTDDLVPHLDGAGNPDRPGWVSVSGPASAHPGLDGVAGSVPLATHELVAYRRTAVAVDADPDVSLRIWRGGLGPFLAAPGCRSAVQDVTVTRVLP